MMGPGASAAGVQALDENLAEFGHSRRDRAEITKDLITRGFFFAFMIPGKEA